MITLRFTITGTVVNAGTREPLANLRVEAWDDDFTDDLVGSAVTDAQGAFTMKFSTAYFSELFADQRPDLYFKVFAGEELLVDTRDELRCNVSERFAHVEIPVSEEKVRSGDEPVFKRFVVRGRITDASATGQAGLHVRAFDQGVDREVQLGEAETGDDGGYRIAYTSNDLSAEDKERADLIVRLYDQRGDGEVTASSPLLLSARDREVVNLLVDDEQYRGRSEYERVEEALAPRLEGANLAALGARSIAVLAEKSGLRPLQVAHYVRAHRDAVRSELAPDLFYGLYRRGLPTSLPRLTAQDTPLLERTITAAANANVVPRATAADAADKASALVAYGAREASRQEAAPANAVNAVLDVAGLGSDEQERFLSRYAANGAWLSAFWDDVAADLGTDKAARLQTTLKLTALTLNNTSLLRAVTGAEGIEAPRELAGYDAADWERVLERDDVELPEGLAGDTDEERRRSYATALAHSVEAAFPTAVFAQRWDRTVDDDTLATFVTQNPTFRLGTDRIGTYLAEHSDALADIQDADTFVEDVRTIERLYRVAPSFDKFEHVYPLFEAGVESAYEIKTMGRTAFMSYATDGTTSTYSQMYDTAVRVSNVALNAYFTFGQTLNDLPVYVLPEYGVLDAASDEVGSADLDSLFGAQDYCQCEHCASVLGPSAYLTDLLAFLDGATAKDGDTGLEKLFERRPDLGNLDLTCENSHTPLPYIDLVNEVLENAIHPRTYTDETHGGTTLRVSDDVPQTEGDAEVLRANPEHHNVEAYDTLAADGSIYPWTLPFSLWREEAAAFLGHLRVPRHELIALFRPDETLARAAEYLGLLNPSDATLENEMALLTTAATGDAALEEAWGVSDVADLNDVLAFTKQAGAEYGDIKVLLETQFLNEDDGWSTTFDDEAPCSLGQATFDGLTNERLDRIHRFVRLQRRLGWTAVELDQALTALGAAEITPAVIEQMAGIQALRQRFKKLALLKLLTWWGSTVGVIDYEDAPSLYETTFLNRAIHNQPDEIEAIFGLNAGRTELADTSQSLTDPDITPLVLAAVGLTEADLDLLVEEELGGDDSMTLESLSLLYRIATLCKALRLSVTEYRSLRVLSGQQAVTELAGAAAPADTVAFVEVLDRLRQADVSIEELDYFLRHAFTSTSAMPPQEAETIVLLEEMRTELQRIVADQTPAADEDLRAALETRLSLVLAADPETASPAYSQEEKVQLALAIIDRTSAQAAADQEAFIDDNFGTFLTDLADAKATLIAPLPPDPADAVTELDDRYSYVLDPLLDYLIPRFMDEYLVQKLAAEMELETSLTSELLKTHLEHPSDATLAAIDYFKSDAFVDSTDAITDDPPFEEAFTITERLYKIALVVRQLGIDAAHADFVFGTGPSIGWIDLATLPLTEASDAEAEANFAAWYKLFRTYELQKERFGEAYAVTDLLALTSDASIARATILDTLVTQTGWNETDVEVLAGSSGFDARFASEGGADTDEAWLLKMDAAFDAIRRTGVSASQLIGWATDGVSYEQARAVKNATKARYDNDQWLEVATELRDELREKQRDALQAYVLHDGGFDDVDALYAYYLIDTEMSACMITARLRQAISSVQLFVQRVLMNLEADQIEFTAEDARQWTWRKTYRVWEANRKVFLFPENWIEPELRDDKTPFFKELEDTLLQNDVTDANVEAAYLTYLRSLDQVAHLDVRTMLYDEDERVTHVFARTKGRPHTYFYRQWHAEEAYWTAWEKLDIDIEGDHLTTFIYNRRLYLCWPTFTERALEKDPSSQSDPEPPVRLYDVQLAWSEYRDGVWSGTSTTEGSAVLIGILFQEDRARYHLRPVLSDPEQVTVEVLEVEPDDDLWQVGSFTMAGCQEGFVAKSQASLSETSYSAWAYGRSIYTMTDTQWQYNFMVSEGAEPLVLDVEEAGTSTSSRTTTVLEDAHAFRTVIPANMEADFDALGPFFYTAANRTFFVLPEDRYTQFWVGPTLDADDRPELGLVDPGLIDVWAGTFIPWAEIPKPEELGGVLPVPGGSPPEPEPDWYFDDAGGGLIFNGTKAGTRVINRADEDALPGLTTVEPAMTPTSLMRAMVGALSGDGADVAVAPSNGEYTALRMETAEPTGGTSLRMLDGHHGTIMAGDLTAQNEEFAMVEGVLYEEGTYSWGGFIPIWTGKGFTFQTFYHPYSCLLIEHLNRYGLEGVLAPDPSHGAEAASLLRQQASATTYFDPDYDPTSVVEEPYPVDDFDFEYDGAYSQYNWELFFHAPLMIATRLMQNQKFEEAQKWFHYIFDPTEVEGDVPDRFWKLRPFHEYAGETNITDLLRLLNEGDEDLERQVAIWEADPFDPHAIARLRTIAYMRTTVMKYLDNLIAWGDHLFRQDTMETINEATQIYVLAAQILGRKPEEVDAADPESQTFNDLYPHLDAFSNALMADLESALSVNGTTFGTNGTSEATSTLDSLFYFCIPNNTQLLGYWGTVAGRLFKIRNCMNIEGARRTLALYEPPIDPGMLVRAAAAGVDLSSALSDLFAPLPAYRFSFMVDRAIELARDVQGLGTALLTALERKDAEELALLRAGHEEELLEAIEAVRERAIEEAELEKAAFERAKAQADERYRFYSERDFVNPGEVLQLVLQGLTFIPHGLALGLNIGAAAAHTVPNFSVGVAGFGGSPNITMSYGGSNVAGMLSSGAAAANSAASILNTGANMAGILGSYERRQEEWDEQAELASIESEQMQHRIDAADMRIRMAERELDNHRLQIEQAGAAYDFLQTKYTSKDLYSWLTTQISTLYFQAYQLAYDTAKRAERAYRHELGIYDTNFIQFGYWDSLKKGLLSGDRLLKDIRRMQMSYVEKNTRKYEITKHVSLRKLNPLALLALQESGSCEFTIPEVLYDLDFPSQYGRRIKTVSLTIPCLAGPYTTVSAKLTLLNSRVRVDPSTDSGYAYQGITDARFLHDLIGTQSISASSAQNDSGLFELSFRDERYVPFEGAGAISTWRLELPGEFRQFDYRSISDAVMHVSYTAREGGDALKAEVEADLADSMNKLLDILAESETGLVQLVSMKNEFPNAFHQLLHPADGGPQTTTIELGPQRFPYILRDHDLQLHVPDGVTLMVREESPGALDTSSLDVSVRSAAASGAWTEDEEGLHAAAYGLSGDPHGAWEIVVEGGSLDEKAVGDVLLAINYKIT